MKYSDEDFAADTMAIDNIYRAAANAMQEINTSTPAQNTLKEKMTKIENTLSNLAVDINGWATTFGNRAKESEPSN